MGFWDWIFPKKCLGCGKEGGYVCGECSVGMWEEEQICPACRRASRYGLKHAYCKRSGGLDGLTCLWAYEGMTRKLIMKAKYRYYYNCLEELVGYSLSLGEREELEYFRRLVDKKPVVVPIPLYPKRERVRGFNQARMIADAVSGRWGLDLREMLVRVKDTGQQVGREKGERMRVMEGAFGLNPSLGRVDSRQVLLVDDVWTTGATMNEAAKVLRLRGAGEIWGLALAR